MLKLEKLVIQGFKSFKRKTSVPFPVGFSCITGPNGAGKTNVTDAFCFVLGERSSKSMRAKKSQNLIFHGSKSKGPAKYAKVTLHFNNKEKDLPLDDDTVTLSRRVNKKGVSTYRLCGKIVTKQQILDVFSQAGVYPDGHNIIQQGDVNKIVEMDAEQRRGIIDEISGIAEYDEKKEKAMKEMEKINEKVEKAQVILEEKQSIMERLKGERDTALKYKTLEKKLSKIRASIILLQKNKNEQSLNEVNKKLKTKNKLLNKLEKDIKRYDSKTTKLERKLEKITKGVLEAEDQLESAKTIAKLESDIDRKTDKIEANKREIDRIKAMSSRMSKMSVRHSPAFKKVMDFGGVHGTVSDLISVPSKYQTALQVSAGGHMRDIVVKNVNTAVKCVKYLKKKKVGRARFMPMNKIKPNVRSKFLPKSAIDWLVNLIKFDKKYKNVMEYIFGTTACVPDIDTAKKILKKQRIRMVTLDGDLVSASGSITGGYYRKKKKFKNKSFEKDITNLEEENKKLAKEINKLSEKLGKLKKNNKNTKPVKVEKNQAKIDDKLQKTRQNRKKAYEKRLVIQQEIGKLNIERAKIEASFENLKNQESDKEKKDRKELKPYIDMTIPVLKDKQKEIITNIQKLGPVNMKALEDFDELKGEFEEFRKKVIKIMDEQEAIEDSIKEIDSKRFGVFNKTMKELSTNFREIYKDLTGGDAQLSLADNENLESGLMIKATPPGKKLLNIDSMSGGEKTLTAFAFVFAIQRFKPAPFYVLDEADAALDKTNTKRVVSLIKKQIKHAQFIVVSHNDHLVREADQIFGVSMEGGESKLFGVKLPENN